MLKNLSLVFAGGFTGTFLRFVVHELLPEAGSVPFATLTVNLLGSFLIGWLAGSSFLERAGGLSSKTGLFLATGLLGGFTTYSALAFDAVILTSQSMLLTFGYPLITVFGGILLALTGMFVASFKSAKEIK